MDQVLTGSLDRVAHSIENANGLPNAHYIDREVFEFERNKLLFGNWAGIGLASDVPEAGDAVPVDFAGLPLLLLRDRDGSIAVFQNTCRHRGMILVEKKCNLRGTIRCPYHSWSYNLDGTLRATPHVGGPGLNYDNSLSREELGLFRIRSHVWRDVVFVNVSGHAADFDVHAASLKQRWHEHEQQLFHGGTDSSFTFDVASNWKLVVENYCESYHLPWVHPGLNSYSRIEDHYHIEELGSFAGQGTRVYRQITDEHGRQFPDFKGLSEFWHRGAEYISFFPNVLFAAQRDHAYVILLLPDGPARTLERVELYYAEDLSESHDFAKLKRQNRELWHGVLEEDLFVVEGMQKGRNGLYFDGGRFAPKMDGPTFVFHRWVVGQLAGAQAD